MTRDDIIRIAREAGLVRTNDGWTEPHRWGMTEIERFAALVAAHKTEVAIAEAYRCGYEAGVVAEREECAKVVDDFGDEWMCDSHMLSKIIRARGKK